MKAYKFKNIAAVITAFLLTVAVGCDNNSNAEVYVYDTNPRVSKLGNITAAENSFASLEWDEKSNVILLNYNDKTFSTTPYDYYMGAEGGSRTAAVCTATIMLNYISQPGNAIKTLYSQDVLRRGAYSAEKIKNGIRVTYYFHSIEAAVPVSFTLQDGYMKVSVDTAEIKEGNQKLYQIAMIPYLTSLPNGTENGYLFIPSGSGALIRTDSEKTGIREYSEAMYGGDAAINTVTAELNTAGATLPLFGVKNGKSAILGIIESGAESCTISATSGDETLGYSAVYPIFPIRGSNQIQVNMIYDGAKQNTAYYADDIIKREISVRYYPLTGEDADYNGMAKTYRNYLQEQGYLKERVENKPLYLSILGGMLTDRLFAGVPYRSLSTATTIAQAQSIIEETEKITGVVPVVQLKGFGTTGLDAGWPASGKTIAKKFGGIKAYNSLTESYPDTFIDFDLINYSKGVYPASKTANNETAYQYDYDVITGSRIETRKVYKLLSRNNLLKTANSLSKSLEKNSVKGVSLSSLSRANYSDYSDSSYALCGGIERDIKIIADGIKIPIMTENANAYSAVISDHIIKVPNTSSKYNSFDEDIPFYQIVFKGYVSMSVQSDLSSSEILDAVESGIGLVFTVADHFDKSFLGLPYSKEISVGVYSDVKNGIGESYKTVSECLAKVGNSPILSHNIISQGIAKTIFENGIAVYVNRSNTDYQSDAGTIPANGFIIS